MQDCKIDNYVYSKHHDRNSCCDYINERPCSVDFNKKLWEPLEKTYPSLVGELDHHQQTIIDQYNGLPLVLMENASEFVGRIKNIPEFLEKVIQRIIDDNKSNYTSLGSYTIPFWEEGDAEDHIKDSKRQIAYLTKKLQKRIKKDKNYVLQIGLELQEDSGHYGIIFTVQHPTEGTKLLIFDSMQGRKNKKGEVLPSAYSDFFIDFAETLFDQEGFMLLDMPLSPQPTGGFVDEKKYTDNYSYLQAYQNMDSQNHYCYFWSIAYFHMYIVNGLYGLRDLFYIIKCNHNNPLTFIKKYIWGILNMMYPSHEDLEKLFAGMLKTWGGKKEDIVFLVKFFLMHFRYIWDNLEYGFSYNPYSIIPCDLSQVRNFKNINDVLVYALEKTPYVLDRTYGQK